jgi:hypothetical protein
MIENNIKRSIMMGETQVESTANADVQTGEATSSDQSGQESTQAEDSDKQNGLDWNQFQEQFDTTPEKAAEILKKQHNANSFFDRRSKELKAKERDLEAAKAQYEENVKLLNDPEYLRKIATENVEDPSDLDDVALVEKKITSHLKSELGPLKDQIKQLLGKYQDQETNNAKLIINNLLAKVDKDFPGVGLTEEESPFRRMVINDIATSYGKEIDYMTPSEVERAFRLSTESMMESLKNKGFTRLDKGYVDKKKQQATQHVTETGKTNMTGFDESDEEMTSLDTKSWIRKIVGPKFKQGMKPT